MKKGLLGSQLVHTLELKIKYEHAIAILDSFWSICFEDRFG